MTRKVVADLTEMDLSRREYLAISTTLAASSIAGCSGGGGGDGSGGGSGSGSTDTATPADTEAPDDTATPTKSDSGEVSEKQRLNIGVSADVQNLDPALTTAASSFQVLENTQERLFRINRNLKVVTELAEDIEISEDGTTYTIPIKEGVQFHPPVERELVADDFVYTFERIMNEDTGSPRSYYFGLVDEVSAEDDYTVRIDLSKPTVSQKVYLASSGTGAIPQEAVEEFGGNLKQHPVGTGPFVFDEWVTGDHTTITAFDNYWKDDIPNFEEITFNVIPKDKVRLTELQTGSIEYITSFSAKDLDAVKNDSNLQLGTVSSPGFNYIGINCGREPLTQVKVRQAIAEGVDLNAVVQAATFGAGKPTQNPFPPQSQWHVDYSPYSTSANPERAKQLLNEAGVSTPVEITLTTDNKYSAHTQGAKVVQANLNQAGFDIEVSLYDWGTFLSREHQEKYDIYVNGWTGFVDPDTYLYPIFHSDGGFNWLNYSNEELNGILEEARVEPSQEKRFELYKQAQRMIIDEAPYVWMFHDQVREAWRKNISGHKAHPLSTVRLDTVNEG